jgi:hypothetical protein
MRLQRSLNVGGLCFAFNEQASPDIMEGVGLGTGRVAFKITDDNVHRGVQASAAEGRLIYTITGEPIHRFL